MDQQPNKVRLIFYLFMVLIPFLLFALIEGSLRLAGYGKSLPLFVPASATNDVFLMPNPNIVERYFHDPKLAPKVAPDTFLFSREKPANTQRIVVMGGSSAAGFPYGRFGSPTGMLKQQLSMIYPHKNIELISVAMASINSYALRDFMVEVAEIRPDAVIIYAGHNEFLGIMGVGSNFAQYGGHWANLGFNLLREMRLFQLLQSTITSLQPSTVKTDSTGRTVMAGVAKEKNIPKDSFLYQQGVSQFESNMSAILAFFERKGIPVFVGNLVSNERDQKPFESADESAGIAQSAALNFRLADEYFAKSDYETAGKHYIRARDLDLLRFRAPSDFNQIIQSLAEQYNATFVDVDKQFRADTKTNIIGKKHILEHLHPTARGYFLMAVAYLDMMLQTGFLEDTEQTLSTSFIEALWSNIPINQVDHLFAEYKIAQLTSDYPFKSAPTDYAIPAPTNQFEQLAVNRLKGESWLAQQQVLLNEFQIKGDLLPAAHVAAVLSEAMKTNHQAANIASKLYLQSNSLRLAHYHARQAVALDSENVSYRLTFAEILFKRGLKQDSINQLQYILRLQPDNQSAKRYLSLIS